MIKFFKSLISILSGDKVESLSPDEILLKQKFTISCNYCDNQESADINSNSEVILTKFTFLGWLTDRIGKYECNSCKRTNTKIYNE